MNRELLQQALWALKDLIAVYPETACIETRISAQKVIATLKAELAKPEHRFDTPESHIVKWSIPVNPNNFGVQLNQTEQALNKKADNARELGLDYEPDVYTKQENLNMSEERVQESDKAIHEPVAYWNGVDMFTRADEVEYTPNWSDYYPEPLYAAPPRKEWVGLTQDEIEEIYIRNTRDNGMCNGLSIALEVQLKLREKNGY